MRGHDRIPELAVVHFAITADSLDGPPPSIRPVFLDCWPKANQFGREPGRSSRATMPLATGVDHARKADRDRPRFPLEGNGRHGRACQDDVGLQGNQLLRERSCPIDVTAAQRRAVRMLTAIGPTEAGRAERTQSQTHDFLTTGTGTPAIFTLNMPRLVRVQK